MANSDGIQSKLLTPGKEKTQNNMKGEKNELFQLTDCHFSMTVWHDEQCAL